MGLCTSMIAVLRFLNKFNKLGPGPVFWSSKKKKCVWKLQLFSLSVYYLGNTTASGDPSQWFKHPGHNDSVNWMPICWWCLWTPWNKTSSQPQSGAGNQSDDTGGGRGNLHTLFTVDLDWGYSQMVEKHFEHLFNPTVTTESWKHLWGGGRHAHHCGGKSLI